MYSVADIKQSRGGGCGKSCSRTLWVRKYADRKIFLNTKPTYVIPTFCMTYHLTTSEFGTFDMQESFAVITEYAFVSANAFANRTVIVYATITAKEG